MFGGRAVRPRGSLTHEVPTLVDIYIGNRYISNVYIGLRYILASPGEYAALLVGGGS